MGTRTQRLTSAAPGSIQRANMQDVAWQDLLGVVYDQLVGATVCILCDAMAVVAVFDRLPVHALRHPIHARFSVVHFARQ